MGFAFMFNEDKGMLVVSMPSMQALGLDQHGDQIRATIKAKSGTYRILAMNARADKQVVAIQIADQREATPFLSLGYKCGATQLNFQVAEAITLCLAHLRDRTPEVLLMGKHHVPGQRVPFMEQLAVVQADRVRALDALTAIQADYNPDKFLASQPASN